jgi:hypothetical protein
MPERYKYYCETLSRAQTRNNKAKILKKAAYPGIKTAEKKQKKNYFFSCKRLSFFQDFRIIKKNTFN